VITAFSASCSARNTRAGRVRCESGSPTPFKVPSQGSRRPWAKGTADAERQSSRRDARRGATADDADPTSVRTGPARPQRTPVMCPEVDAGRMSPSPARFSRRRAHRGG
jgi:hypothetical protein